MEMFIAFFEFRKSFTFRMSFNLYAIAKKRNSAENPNFKPYDKSAYSYSFEQKSQINLIK